MSTCPAPVSMSGAVPVVSVTESLMAAINRSTSSGPRASGIVVKPYVASSATLPSSPSSRASA